MTGLLKRPWLWPILTFLLAAGWLARGVLGYRHLLAQENALVEEIGRLKAEAATPAERALPLDPARLPRLYKALVRLAEETGVELKSLAPGEGSVELGLEGPFEKLYALLVRLSDLPYPVWIQSYSLTPLTPRAERLALALTLGVRLKTPEGEAEPTP